MGRIALGLIEVKGQAEGQKRASTWRIHTPTHFGIYSLSRLSLRTHSKVNVESTSLGNLIHKSHSVAILQVVIKASIASSVCCEG